MVALDYFYIQLHNKSGVFLCGDRISGTFNFKVTKRFAVKRIIVAAIGEAYVHWTEHKPFAESITDTDNYGASEKFYGFETDFESNGGYLEEGEYSKPFQFVLPFNLPTSFEQYNGKIRHRITGTFQIPWGKNKVCYKVITVINPFDLNLFPALKEPKSTSHVKEFSVLFFKSGSANIKFDVRQTGFVPGQKIICDVRIDNQSSKCIDKPTIALCESCKLKASIKTKIENRNVLSIQLPRAVQAHSIEEFRAVEMVVPPVCPSTSETCKVIEISYFLQLTVGANGLLTNNYLKIPITIGTIPISFEKNPNQYAFSYEPGIFGEPKLSETQIDPTSTENPNVFKPQYPYYQHLPA